jgi:hypothetical protein
MVKVTLELTENELEFFSHCIESAIDIEHIKNIQDKIRAGEMLKNTQIYPKS